MLAHLKQWLHSDRCIWVALALGGLIRVAYALREPLLEWDAYLYRDIARHLLAGRGYTLDGITPDTWWAPVPTWIIAGLYSLGANDLGLRLVWAGFGLLTIVVAYRLTRENFSLPAANLAALAVALYPYNILLGGSTGTETPNILFVLLAIWLLLRWQRAPLPATAALAGLVLGVATLTRPASLPFIVLAAGWMVYSKQWRSALLLALVATAMLAPWSARTTRVTGKFNVTTSLGPMNLWWGNNPWFGAYSRGELPAKEYSRQLTAIFPTPPADQRAADQQYIAATRQFYREHPRQAAHLLLFKSLKFWQVPGLTAAATTPTIQKYKWAILLIGCCTYLPAALLAGAALLAAARRREFNRYGLVVVWILVTFATNVWFPGVVRYRFAGAVDELLLILAAVFLVNCLHERSPRPPTPPV